MREFDCAQLEAVLNEGEAEDVAAARAHAAQCESCRREVEAWDQVAAWATGRRQNWASPGLWPRIREGMTARTARPWAGWQAWLAAAAMLVLTVSAVWLVRRPVRQEQASREFLTQQALSEAEASRSAYVHSIERLAELAAPVLKDDKRAAMPVYREKLQLLDQAIAEVRHAAAENPLNAQVQAELASLYDEKLKTLREVLKYADSENPGV